MLFNVFCDANICLSIYLQNDLRYVLICFIAVVCMTVVMFVIFCVLLNNNKYGTRFAKQRMGALPILPDKFKTYLCVTDTTEPSQTANEE